MASKEIVTMPCDPGWDPWVWDENSEFSIFSHPWNSTGWGTNPLGAVGEDTSIVSHSGLPMVTGSVIITVTAIKDPELNEFNNPKDPVPTEYSVELVEPLVGVRKGDFFNTRFHLPVLRDLEEGEEVDPEDLVDGRVVLRYQSTNVDLKIETLSFDPIGPSPGQNIDGVNNMFWENWAADCKHSGRLLSDDAGASLRRMGTNAPGANWLIESPGNKWDSFCGWDLLFTGHTPNNDGRQSGKHPKKGTCLQLATNNQMSAGQGIILGNWTAHQTTEVARWMNPTGVQFQWTTNNTPKKNANGLKLKQLWLIYKEANDGVPRYCPVIDNYRPMGIYEHQGGNLINSHQKRGQYGNFRASISAEDIIHVNERDSVCIAMLLVFNNAKAGAVYYNIIDIYNFTFLFYNAKGTIDEYTGIATATTPPTLPTNSRIIVPPPFAMSEWDSGYFPIF